MKSSKTTKIIYAAGFLVFLVAIFISYNCKFNGIVKISGYKYKSGMRVAEQLNATDSNATDSNATDSNATDSNATDSNATDSNATDSNATDSNADQGGEELNYTVRFNSNGGTGTMDDVPAKYGVEFTLPKNKFTRAGYIFKGWSPNSTGEPEYADGQKVINLSTKDGEVFVLFAIWEQIDSSIINPEQYELVDESVLIRNDENLEIIDFKDDLNLCSTCTINVYDNAGNELNYNELVGTGTVTKVFKDGQLKYEFVNVVLGDTTGDGRINIADVIKLADHTVTKNVLSEVEIKAAEITKDSKLTIADVIKLADHTVDKSIKLWEE